MSSLDLFHRWYIWLAIYLILVVLPHTTMVERLTWRINIENYQDHTLTRRCQSTVCLVSGLAYQERWWGRSMQRLVTSDWQLSGSLAFSSLCSNCHYGGDHHQLHRRRRSGGLHLSSSPMCNPKRNNPNGSEYNNATEGPPLEQKSAFSLWVVSVI